MRKILLAAIFAAIVSQLSAQLPPPPPPPSENIWWDGTYTKITTNMNGDFVLKGGCWGYGKSASIYSVWMVAYDKFGGTHTLYADIDADTGDWPGWWVWPNNYNGDLMWNQFTLVVPKDSKYWNEIDLHGVATVSVYLNNFDTYPPSVTVSASTGNKLKLP